MSKHNETGIKGEQIAEKFLLAKGYIFLHRNWCHGKKEIDLIMQKDDLLVFVEVKTRSGAYFGFPEEAVNRQKQAHLKSAASAFVGQFPRYTKVQFDIISIVLERDNPKEVLHFEDAFF